MNKQIKVIGLVSFFLILVGLLASSKMTSQTYSALTANKVLSANTNKDKDRDRDREHPSNRFKTNNHDTSKFNPDNPLAPKACGDKLGNPVIDITQKVLNDVDSGLGSNNYFPSETNYWNVESYIRQIKVWKTGDTTWCATVAYTGGHFDAFYNQTGPGGTGLIGADVTGEMRGGYRATFTGTLSESPAWKLKGSVGTFDYKCDLHASCSGRVDWIAQYFPGYSDFAQPWWGWIYKAGKHGTWINYSEANSGNIL